MFATGSRRRSWNAVDRSAGRWRLALVCAGLVLVSGCSGPPMRTGSDARTVQIVSHEVASGETCASIADDFYGKVAASSFLREANGIPRDAEPEVGAVLEVPVGREDIERYERRTEAKILYNRATVLAGEGDLGKAAEEFRAALRVDPRFVDAGYNLGVVLIRLGEPARAVAILEQVVRVREGDPDLTYALGSAQLEAGNTREALALFEDVVEMDPSHEDGLFSRALALLELGRTEEAVFHLDAYVREFPDGEWARSARARLSALEGERGDAD
jgi:tetratricopeptide (TPR) repeat protein